LGTATIQFQNTIAREVARERASPIYKEKGQAREDQDWTLHGVFASSQPRQGPGQCPSPGVSPSPALWSEDRVRIGFPHFSSITFLDLMKLGFELPLNLHLVWGGASLGSSVSYYCGALRAEMGDAEAG
jgi:hypothetical protein